VLLLFQHPRGLNVQFQTVVCAEMGLNGVAAASQKPVVRGFPRLTVWRLTGHFQLVGHPERKGFYIPRRVATEGTKGWAGLSVSLKRYPDT
jgi:hypothetical protein